MDMKRYSIITLLALPLFACVVSERVATYYDMTTGEQLIPQENKVLVEALVECFSAADDAIPYPEKPWEHGRHGERRQHRDDCLLEKGYETRWVPYEDYSLITE